MSGLAILYFSGVAVISLWGIYLGVAGCLAESPPFMKGEGKRNRYARQLKKAA